MSDPLKVSGGADLTRTVRSSRDTFDMEKKRNWLVNSAGIGIYAHGRIHQQGGNEVYVGDLIHALGNLASDNILLMEEQAMDSMGDPLTAPSRLGPLVALAVLPTMNTANGEGDLIAYYRAGVVAFNTHEAPRETRMGGSDNTEIVRQGWDTKRLVNHLLNKVSAVGRYAVATLTRDHFFRSAFGLHFLKSVIGEGTYNTEQINRVSHGVQPVLDADNPSLLHGAACGFWLQGNRMFASCGLTEDHDISAMPFGRGFVSWNQANLFTDDRTPLPAWEGVWTFDAGVAGVHWFGEASPLPEDHAFGFTASDHEGNLFFVTIDDGEDDYRDGEDVPIEWSVEFGRYDLNNPIATKVLTAGQIDFLFKRSGRKARVLVRTDRSNWMKWHEFGPDKEAMRRGQVQMVSESMGKPPREVEEATWFQIRVEAIGAGEIHGISLDIADGQNKSGRKSRSVLSLAERDPFETNRIPASERWS